MKKWWQDLEFLLMFWSSVVRVNVAIKIRVVAWPILVVGNKVHQGRADQQNYLCLITGLSLLKCKIWGLFTQAPITRTKSTTIKMHALDWCVFCVEEINQSKACIFIVLVFVLVSGPVWPGLKAWCQVSKLFVLWGRAISWMTFTVFLSLWHLMPLIIILIIRSTHSGQYFDVFRANLWGTMYLLWVLGKNYGPTWLLHWSSSSHFLDMFAVCIYFNTNNSLKNVSRFFKYLIFAIFVFQNWILQGQQMKVSCNFMFWLH